MSDQAQGFEVSVDFNPIVAELGAEVGNLRAQLAVKEGIIRGQHTIIEEQKAMISLLTAETEKPPAAPAPAAANGKARKPTG